MKREENNGSMIVGGYFIILISKFICNWVVRKVLMHFCNEK